MLVGVPYSNYIGSRDRKTVSPTLNRPLSLSGVEVKGQKLTRYVYADEAGISANEPISVVAGLIVRLDSQWAEVEKHIEGLLTEYVPKDALHPGYAFHMTDIFSGRGVYKRPEYSLDKAISLMTALVSIPKDFGIPIALGVFQKLPQETMHPDAAEDGMSHAMAYLFSVMMAEKYLREQTEPLEVARLIAENNDTTRNHVDEMHEMLQGTFRTPARKHFFNLFAEQTENSLPITKLPGSVHFARKDQEIMLQLADAVAFMMRRAFEGKSDVEQFIKAMIGATVVPPFNPDIGAVATIISAEYWRLPESPK